MAKAKGRFTISKTKTKSEFESRLELRGAEAGAFFRGPSKFLQAHLRRKGLKFRKVTVSKIDRRTIQPAISRAGGRVIIIINGRWMHIDFDTQNPELVCEWYFEVTEIIVVVEQA